MGLAAGSRLGPYEIQSPIGAGGMGEVYKARDTRLDRTVAIKVLPPEFSADPDRRTRFEREAKAISQLTHPHICTLHDIGRDGDTTFLVMELLDGESLAVRLAPHPTATGDRARMPLDEVLQIGRDVADALEAAHRHGIVHRDLKPGNVILTKQGAKLLDFGLAKLRPVGAVGIQRTQVETTAAGTAAGTLLGTVPYMAPEQLEGKDADHRADIWALGCLIYEMASGRRAFEGKSQASLIGAIMTTEPPPLRAEQPLTPSALDHVVRTCLAKDPDDRWQSAADVRRELLWIIDERRAGPALSNGAVSAALPHRDSAGSSVRRGHAVSAWMWLASMVVVAGATATAVWLGRGPASAPKAVVTRSSILVSPIESVESMPGPVTGGSRVAVALSPDGQRLAFIGRIGGRSQLYVRPLSGDASIACPGTEGAESPAFSADGKWIAFWAGGRLMKVPAEGGPVTEICALAENVPPLGMSWGSDGTIVFGRTRGGLMRVPADGGQPAELTTLESNEVSHRLPHMLPGSQWVLFTARTTAWLWGAERIVAQSLVSRERRLVVEGGADATSVPSGHLLYMRTGTLCARAFDSATVQVSGAELGMVEKVSQAVEGVTEASQSGAGQYAVSDTGTLVYLRAEIPPPPRSELVVIDRNGRVSVVPTDPAAFFLGLTLAPDGQTVAAPTRERDKFALWTVNLARGTMTSLVSGGEITWPLWGRNGRIAFSWRNAGGAPIAWASPDSAAAPEPIVRGPAGGAMAPLSWSHDGKTLCLAVRQPAGDRDISLMSLDDSARKLTPLVHTPANEINGVISPDEKWIAYASDETGRYEVYLQEFPHGGGKNQVSKGGGLAPMWNPNGRELFYVSLPDQAGKRWLMSMSLTLQPKPLPSPPRPLFEFPRSPGTVGRNYDVFADGNRFVTIRPLPAPLPSRATEIRLVDHWFEELRAKVSVKR